MQSLWGEELPSSSALSVFEAVERRADSAGRPHTKGQEGGDASVGGGGRDPLSLRDLPEELRPEGMGTGAGRRSGGEGGPSRWSAGAAVIGGAGGPTVPTNTAIQIHYHPLLGSMEEVRVVCFVVECIKLHVGVGV